MAVCDLEARANGSEASPSDHGTKHWRYHVRSIHRLAYDVQPTSRSEPCHARRDIDGRPCERHGASALERADADSRDSPESRGRFGPLRRAFGREHRGACYEDCSADAQTETGRSRVHLVEMLKVAPLAWSGFATSAPAALLRRVKARSAEVSRGFV